MVILFFLPIPLNDFAANMNAAAVIRQPYRPSIGHSVSVGAVGLSHRGSRKTQNRKHQCGCRNTAALPPNHRA